MLGFKGWVRFGSLASVLLCGHGGSDRFLEEAATFFADFLSGASFNELSATLGLLSLDTSALWPAGDAAQWLLSGNVACGFKTQCGALSLRHGKKTS